MVVHAHAATNGHVPAWPGCSPMHASASGGSVAGAGKEQHQPASAFQREATTVHGFMRRGAGSAPVAKHASVAAAASTAAAATATATAAGTRSDPGWVAEQEPRDQTSKSPPSVALPRGRPVLGGRLKVAAAGPAVLGHTTHSYSGLKHATSTSRSTQQPMEGAKDIVAAACARAAAPAQPPQPGAVASCLHLLATEAGAHTRAVKEHDMWEDAFGEDVAKEERARAVQRHERRIASIVAHHWKVRMATRPRLLDKCDVGCYKECGRKAKASCRCSWALILRRCPRLVRPRPRRVLRQAGCACCEPTSTTVDS